MKFSALTSYLNVRIKLRLSYFFIISMLLRVFDGWVFQETLGPFFLTRANFSYFSRKNGSRYLKTFCGRLISEKFHVLKTPWKPEVVNPKPEVVEIMTLEGWVMTHIEAYDSLITMMSHMTHFDKLWRHKWRFSTKNQNFNFIMNDDSSCSLGLTDDVYKSFDWLWVTMTS